MNNIRNRATKIVSSEVIFVWVKSLYCFLSYRCAFFIRLQKAQNYAQTSVIEPVPKSEIASGRESETELPTKKEAELSNEKEIDNFIDQ